MQQIIDAHHHLWTLGNGLHPWVEERGRTRFFGDPTPIQQDYPAEAFEADWDGLQIIGSVHVQVGTAPGREVEETSWLTEEAMRRNVPSAIVAYADLCSTDLEDVLDAHCASSDKVRGIRQIVSRHPAEDSKAGMPDLLSDERFLAGLKILAGHGLSFDLQLTAPLLPKASSLFSRTPDLAVALCHAGSPWDQTPDGLKKWRQDLAEFAAAVPKSAVKLSGIGMLEPKHPGQTPSPIVAGALEAFGPSRAMWGSNFPVDKLYRSYRQTLDAVRQLVPEQDQDAVFRETAARFYRI